MFIVANDKKTAAYLKERGFFSLRKEGEKEIFVFEKRLFKLSNKLISYYITDMLTF